MKTQRVNEANANASGNISTDTINKHTETLANHYAKNMKIDGFRKGKVPVSVVKSRYKENLKEESRQKSIDEFYTNAIKELGLEEKEIIGQPLIVKFDEKDTGIDIELKIGITPKFELDNISSCIPKFELEKVTDKQVEEHINRLAKDRAPAIESQEKELKEGLIGNINFEGFVDNVAFDGGKAENFDLMIGSKQFIPGFEESLIGMQINEEKTIDVKFPENYQAPNLAGKNAQFKVKLNSIKQKADVKIDDAFAKSIIGKKEENTLEKLKQEVKKDLEKEAKFKLYNEKLKQEVLENISKTFNFDLPENIIEQEMSVLFNNEVSTLKQEELESLKKDKEKGKALFEAQREKATTSVKVTFIMDKLAKQEKISVDDNEVFQTMYYESMMNGQNPQEVIEYYRKNNLLPAVKMAIIEDRVITHLLDKNNGF
ncbi:trigger factor [Helicobacter didelphidarum]|uniref:Trigger factor n=1 Tax=Helicobacter didelphidarum TaxID=2040648 RepID=A0A3D8IBI2_9HELI|nr:trigger factor [Helicobacter didelphidarum]RDU62480.1 trigger factor [Helicobacter didelphidarum]